MRAAHEIHLHVRRHILAFERRQPGLVGSFLSGVLDPILGGPTTTQTQPAQTTTTGGANPKSTATPSPAGNTPILAKGGGGSSTASPNSGTGNGRSGGDTAGGGTSTAGSPTGTGTASSPSGSSSPNENRVSGSTSSGGTTIGTNGDPSKGSGSGTESNSGTRGGSSGPSSEGSSTGSGTSGNGDSSNPSPSDVKTLGDSKGNNSHGGAIAAAIILTLLLGVAVVFFILRRRSNARRDDQANRWWFTRKRTSQNYGDEEAIHTGNSSRRSSFATTVDHSNASFLAKTAIPPLPPPMAEVGRSNGAAPALVFDINADPRFSIGSAGSHNSQFLIIHRESLLHEATSSARTEFFPFPKPPIADRVSLHSKISWSSQPELKQDGDLFCISAPSSPSQTTQPQLPADPFADPNPFEDPSRAVSPFPDQNVTGTVRRPFSPQLQDELQVDIGDTVRILQSFDDGWALAEKLDASDGRQGFIPLECFHDIGQFSLRTIRRSSNSTEGLI